MKHLVVIVCMLVSSVAYADPSLQETIDYIYEKTDLEWNGLDGNAYSKQKIKIDDCNLMIENLSKKSSSYGRWQTFRYSASLSELDPTAVKVEEGMLGNPGVALYVFKRKKKVSVFHEIQPNDVGDWVSHGYNCKKKSKDVNICNKAGYGFSDRIGVKVLRPEEFNAPKLARAFEHLIKLCGGKGELF